MNSVIFICLSIAWGVGGFLLGFITGTLARRSLGESMSLVESPPTTAKPRRWYQNAQLWLGALVATVGLGTAFQWYAQGERTEALVQCQSAYANGFADAIERRNKETRDVAEGQDKLWLIFQEALTASAPPADIRERFKTELDNYLTQRAESKRVQTENPLPPPPRDLCS